MTDLFQRAGNRAGAWASIALLLPGLAFSQIAESTTSNQDRARILLETSLKDKNPETRTHAVESLGLVSATEPWLSDIKTMLTDKISKCAWPRSRVS